MKYIANMNENSSNSTALHKKSPFRRTRSFIRMLRHGIPQPHTVHQGYNTLRQEYILDATRHHFKKRDDDPAPLFQMNLLDVGCGASPINSFLALSGADVTALDIDEKILKEAQTYADSIGTPIRFIHGKIEELLKEETQYDV
ncbi:MAG: methyltransferase domain-containing protein, partial [Alphaproteobacteria bacterium]|nr:methyltransferase domain-containing protein [Alphaproteobacteria bacterium]